MRVTDLYVVALTTPTESPPSCLTIRSRESGTASGSPRDGGGLVGWVRTYWWSIGDRGDSWRALEGLGNAASGGFRDSETSSADT